MRERTVEERLTVAETAQRLKVNPSTIWRMVRDGKIEGVEKLGRRITRIRASAINKFLDGCRVD